MIPARRTGGDGIRGDGAYPAQAETMRRRPMGGPPPLPRSINRSTVLGLSVSAAAVALILFSANESVRDRIWLPELEFMVSVAENRVGWLTDVLRPIHNFTFRWGVPLIVWPALAVLVATRRIRSAMTFFVGFLLVALVVSILQDIIVRPRPVGIVIEGRWEGFAHPDLKLASVTAALTSVALHSIPHGAARRVGKILAGFIVVVLGFAAIYLGVMTPTAVGASIAIGFAIPQVLFRLITPPEVFPVRLRAGNTAHLEMTDERVAAICSGVEDQLGITVTAATPIALGGSAGSTPLRLDIDEPDMASQLFAKLYARSHLRSDRAYKIGRTLLYGRLEDEATFTSVRRLVEYEDYLSAKLAGCGVLTAHCHGVVELTPEREYVVVFDFLDGAAELDDTNVTRSVITDGLDAIELKWHGGLAHRDIKPSNLMVTAEGRLAIIDVAFGEIRPTRWRQLVDLGNMLLVLAVHSDPATVHELALERFSPDEIADALAAAHGVAIPTQLRNALKQSDRDIAAELAELAPTRGKIGLQRWSLTRLALGAAVLASAVALFVLIAGSAQLAGLLP